ncbi:hypothetical protein ScPMuIL_000322 [Solemya velum]
MTTEAPEAKAADPSVFVPDVPDQIHLSFGDTPGEMVVMWSTSDDTDGYVAYWEFGQDSRNVANSTTAMLGDENVRAKRKLHRAVMKNLTRGTQHAYSVISMNCCNLTSSGVFNFTTMPDGHDWPTRFLVYGDMGSRAGVPTFPLLEEEVGTGLYHAVWHVGDLAYDLHSGEGAVGDDFMRKIEKIAAQIPYMTSPGNHEIAVETTNDFGNYRTRFSMPNIMWPMPINKLWYSYNVGLAHVISYSTEVYFTYNQDYVCDQYYWLLDDLIQANKNRAERPWVIAMGHRPMYCSNNNGDYCTGGWINRFVKYGLDDLFYAQGVDVIIEAHEHSYERLWPVYDGIVTEKSYKNPRAPVHIISGAAGCQEGIDKMKVKGGVWSAFKADSRSNHTYGRILIPNATHFLFEQISVKDKYILDSFWLHQKNHGSFEHNVTCEGDSRHPSCSCPPPFHFETIMIICATSLLIVIVSIIFLCTIFIHHKCRGRRNHHLRESEQKLLDPENTAENSDDDSFNKFLGD